MPEFGLAGAEVMCENLTNELIKSGNEVIVVSLYDFKSPITERFERKGIKLINTNKRTGLDLSIINKLRNIFKTQKPDVIHTHRYVLQYVIPATLGLGIKRIIHTVHNIAEKENTKPARILNKIFFHHFGVIPVALSDLIKQSIENEYNLNSARIPIIFNGIPLNQCLKKNDYKTSTNIHILHIGRYSEQKNHIEMLKAIVSLHKKKKNIILHLVGEGPLKISVLNFVKNNSAEDYIIEHGTTDNPYPFFNKADIFLLPSKYEGMPMTLIEAMGSALPIVASRVGGIPDIIRDSQEGLLCSPVASDIEKCLITLIKNEKLRRDLALNAYLKANTLSSTKMSEEYQRLYIGELNR